MSDYNFSGLSPRSFEQMIQALSIKLIGPNIIIFGDGPDGGREATFDGSIPYPSATNQWDGYGVIQAKFLQRPETTKGQGDWALAQLRSELEAFSDPEKERRKPEYYIFVTNAVLSPVKDVGAKDKAKAVFDEFKSTVSLRDYDIWDYDKLRAFLDNNDEVRKKYAAFITAGDVLAEMMKQIAFDRPDFESTLTNFLEKELLTDQFANLEQAGHATNDRIPIARVFTDLPTRDEPVVEIPEESQTSLSAGFVGSVIRMAKERLNPSLMFTEDASLQHGSTLGRLVLIGGPGQGKTTLGQFCCQLFRTALLKDRPQHSITPPGKEVVNAIISFCEREAIELPSARRFPLRIQLSAFASALASKEQPEITSVLTYLIQLIAKRTSLSISANDFRQWLRDYPWLIVLDGLDEVPSSTNRPDVLNAIQDFWVDAAQLDADLLVIATTRPQGYNDDFSPRYYDHRWLTPLSKARALHYGELLARARYGNEPERCGRIIERLTRASQHPATARLMRSPLQVTIMATLVERMGTPPQERWQLFKSYYEIIYMREMERDLPAAIILRDYRSDIDAIHNLVGLLLQIESERTGATEAELTADRFATVVRARLESEGHTGSELQKLEEQIIDAAANRLVFLVGLQENRIGFEIRSLQEFMASEALMDAKDEIIGLRLRSIAVIANWRNVFLFAAGKCFAVQQALRDTVVTTAAQLNEDVEDRALMTTLAGSQLCLDLLADGSSRHQPKYGRSLAHIALKLLYHPPSDHQRRLATSYDQQFEELYKVELTNALDSSIPEHRLGAWVCLFNLYDAGVDWAETMAEKYWSRTQNIDDLVRVMVFVSFRSTGSWFTQKVLDNLHAISRRALYDNEMLSRLLEKSEDPLLSAIGAAAGSRRFRETNDIAIQTHSVPAAASLASARASISFWNTSLQGNYASEIKPLRNITSPAGDWAPLVLAARFLDEPNAVNLAEAIRSLAGCVIWDTTKFPVFGLPWPIAACLGVCANVEDIKTVAARAESGDFGDFHDWELAEQRWQTQGLTWSDFEYMTDERLPFTKSIATVGFPFTDATLGISVSSSPTLQDEVAGLLEIYRNVSSGRVKGVVGHSLLFAMNVFQRSKDGPTVDVSADEFKRLVVNVVRGSNRIWAGALGALPLTEPISNEWIETIDFVGQQDHMNAGTINAPTLAILSRIFLRDPKLQGVMRVLALASSDTDLPTIPAEMIRPENFSDIKYRNAAAILTIRQRHGATSNGVLAKFTAALLQDNSELDIMSWLRGKRDRTTEAENSFLFALLNELPPSSWKSRQNIVRGIEKSLSGRTSGLDQPNTWESLKLPIKLRDFFNSENQPH